ncbi:hypothetical protein ACHAW6_000318 [Cyclotella cf. meneghiniana]
MPVGAAQKQPAMDTHVYKVHFPDSRTEELAVNTIAEALYTQCDPDGNQCIMLDAIVDYRKNPDVAIAWNDQVKIVNELCCEWKDSRTSLQKLSNLKESYSLQVDEFAIAVGISNEPAFNWYPFSRRKTGLSAWLSAKAFDTTSGPTSLGWSSPKLWMRLTRSTKTLILPFGVM